MRPGRRAEELVEWGCRRLAQAGVAFVRKTNPPVLIRRSGGRIAGAAHVGSAPPDFLGFTLKPWSRGVCFEAKQAGADGRFHWDPRNPMTRERELADLEEAGAKFNAVSGVLVVFFAALPRSQVDRAAWVPWWRARELAEGSWTFDRITARHGGIGVPCPWPAGGDPDWLAAEEAARADRGLSDVRHFARFTRQAALEARGKDGGA